MFESISKVLLIAVTLCCLTPTTAWAQKAADKSSPFEEVRWNDDAPEVKVGDVWYRPVAIEVPLQPADHLLGEHDTVLDAAIEHLTSK